MRIFIDIGHPAHVHYFKNFICIMKKKGHQFCISARNKEIVHYLLSKYDIKFQDRGKGGNGLIGKFIYLFKADFELYKIAKNFGPDIFISFGSSYAAQVSKLLNRSHLAFDDTEHAIFEHLMYVPFTDIIFTPKNFRKHFGNKHLYFDGTMDLCYLHPRYFKPDDSIFKFLDISPGEDFIFVRFVSWAASHDIGHHGFSTKNKIKLIEELSKYCRVFISAEGHLPEELQEYKINIPFELIHSVLYYAKLYLGESTSMATEAATIGTPAICVNSSAKLFGVFDDFIKYNLIDVIPEDNKAIKRAIDIIGDNKYKSLITDRLQYYLNQKIDVTAFMVWFVENYPYSARIMRKNPEYQYRFR